jgi:hypothetical protein
VAAARQLLSGHGYFATKVDEIVALVRVAPATVYAVSVGKQGVLRTPMETATADPIVDATIEHVVHLDEPLAIAECSFKVSKPNYARERGSTIAKPGCRVTAVTIHRE